MPSSRKRKRPSGPQERCQRSASSQSSSDDNRSGGRGCGRIITTIASVATTSKSHVSSHHAPHAAIAIASQMANDLKPEHKLPNRDILVTPKPNFQQILRTVGADKSILTAREVLSYLIKYISSRKLYDDKDPKKVYCKDDPLGKVFGVDTFTIKDAKRLLFDNLIVINRGGGIPTAHISQGKKEYYTLVQSVQEADFPGMLLPMKQRSDCYVHKPSAPATITEAMDSTDGVDAFPKPKPRSNPNPLVMSATSGGCDVLPPPVPYPPPATISSPAPRPVSMDTAEDVKTATANVANLFRSVSLDVDPSQEGPSTAATTMATTSSVVPSSRDESPMGRMDKPGGKRNAKTRLPSEDTSDSKSKSPPASKSPPSQSDDTSEAGGPSTRQWVRLHYRPGEETKSVSSERLSVQDYETVVVADSSDDLWFVEQEVSEFEIEYSVGDSSEGAPSKDGSDDSSSEAGVVFEISPDDSSDSRWADDSSSTDTEISDQDKWDCIECQNRNPPVDRYCNRCWVLRTGWLPDEQRMTLRERLLNQAKLLRRSNSAPAGHVTSPHNHAQCHQLTADNLTKHNNLTRTGTTGPQQGVEDMEAMDTVEASQAPMIFPGRSSEVQCYQAGNDPQQYPPQHTLPPQSVCDRGYSMVGGSVACGTTPYQQQLEVIPDDEETDVDNMELCPQLSGVVGRDFPDGNEDKEAAGRQCKNEENGTDSAGGGNQQGGPPNSQDGKSFGRPGFPDGSLNMGPGDTSTSPRHAFGQATFGQPSFGQTTFSHSPAVNTAPPESNGPRVFGQDLEGYSPSAGPKPGGGQSGIIQQGHFKSSLSEASSDSHQATCSPSTLSLSGSEKGSLNLNDPIARKRMKMDTQRQDSGLGLSQEFSEKSELSQPDNGRMMCNDNYTQMRGNAAPLPARRRRSSTSEIEFGYSGSQETTTTNASWGSGNQQEGAIDSKPAAGGAAADPLTSLESQTKVPDICGFCFKRPKNASIIHGKTGHQVCCYQCAKKLRRRGKPCPICRQSIQAVIKNFLV